MLLKACNVVRNGEILNRDKIEYPLFNAILCGDKVLTAKLSKRLSCAIKHLPLRVQFEYQYDTLKALESGVEKDPTLILDGEIFLEGLPQAEQITKAFEKLLENKE